MIAVGTRVGPVLDVTPADHARHPMHAAAAHWPQTNCSIDPFIEVLHARGLPPEPIGACALSADQHGDQWTFLKLPPADLFRLYGITLAELTLWRPILKHVVDHLSERRLVTIEVDSQFLPDTVGISYQLRHVKTTIVPNLVDVDGRRLEYFHNDGYFELAGSDFDRVFRVGEPIGGQRSPALLEVLDLDGSPATDLDAVARALGREHLSRRRPGNALVRFADRVRADLPWLAQQDVDTFHRYAFATVRQCGATAQIAADFCRWLGERGQAGLLEASAAFLEVAGGAKTLQFQLARAARGRAVTLDVTLGEMTQAWQQAMDVTAACLS